MEAKRYGYARFLSCNKCVVIDFISSEQRIASLYVERLVVDELKVLYCVLTQST